MGNDAATDIHGELSDKELSGRGEWRGIVDSIPWTIGDRTARRCSAAAPRREANFLLAKLQTTELKLRRAPFESAAEAVSGRRQF